VEGRAVIPGFLAGLAIGIVIVIVLLIFRSRRSSAPTAPREAAHVMSTPPAIADHGGIHLRHQVVVKEQMIAKVTPDGLTVTIDGQEYHRLEDIPDQARAAQVRTLLASTTASVTDPTTRASMEKELRDVGIEPDETSGAR
jgi:hypothetical protein